MGFLQAVYSLGEMASETYKDSSLADILNFLQLPYSLPQNQKEKIHAIRIWLSAADNKTKELDINGVAKIDRIEYGAIGGDEKDEIKIKELCLYREPVGRNVSWHFSPLLRLGTGGKNSLQKLAGENGIWQNDKKCIFYKLYHTILKDYVKSGYFTENSVDRIMADLANQIDKIAELWSDKKIQCFLMLGLKEGEKFLYPGEVTAFVDYFRKKLVPNQTSKNKKNEELSYCALCHKNGQAFETLDKVFKFATFDKPGFLPGAVRTAGVEEKVFPVCKTCYEILSAGKEVMEKRFVNLNIIPNISLFVIPEIISDRQEFFRKAVDQTENFVKKGIRTEKEFFRYLSRQNEAMVFHFLFAEINQAQIIIHSLVEDVPPTRLRRLQELWEKTCQVYSYNEDVSDKKCNLDTAISQIVAVLMSLAGKSDQDRKVMKDKVISVISSLLNGEAVGIKEIKTLVVSRLPGLITDPDWLKPSDKDKMLGRQKIRGMAEVVDFLYRVNRR